jgi:hypothetical protein
LPLFYDIDALTPTIVLWKSDVAGAFRLVPLHKLWQIKQIITTNYPTKADKDAGIDRGPLIRRVDWRACFGSRASPRDWSSVMGLVLWIAWFIKMLIDIFAYVDDNFGWEEADNFMFYEPYQQSFPAKQVGLLSLWDELGVPHKLKKQVWGEIIVIIGFLVDANNMTITLPADSKARLIAAIEDFMNTSDRRRIIHEWEQLAGWMSWSLNVFPLLRPGLCNIYLKLSEKENKWSRIYLNKGVKDDLSWFLRHVQELPGILLFGSMDWHPLEESDIEIRCDACLSGMGFWSPTLAIGRFASIPCTADEKIFFWEAVCVLAALEWFVSHATSTLEHVLPHDRTLRLTVMTDNLNTVQIFDSLAARPGYNDILKASVDLLIQHNIDLRVVHIAGAENEVADLISREKFDEAKNMVPDLLISTFQPPSVALGAVKK